MTANPQRTALRSNGSVLLRSGCVFHADMRLCANSRRRERGSDRTRQHLLLRVPEIAQTSAAPPAPPFVYFVSPRSSRLCGLCVKCLFPFSCHEFSCPCLFVSPPFCLSLGSIPSVLIREIRG